MVFWGTPDFGLPALDAMRAAGHEIVGVVTNPDRPAGRGRRLTASPVKRWALEHGVPVLQPDRPRGDAFLAELGALAPDISVVAAYGQILRQEVLDAPPMGSLNIHASLLPALRGAAPINWAIMRGHEEAGVTIMRMVLDLDAGPMLARRAIPIGPTTTAGGLYDRAARAGGDLLVETLAALSAGTAVEREQDHDAATYAPKLDRETARIDWSRSAAEVGQWIRGCDPWPAAWTTFEGEPLQCFAPAARPGEASGRPPGTILSGTAETGLIVATGDGSIRIGEVKPAGRRRMPADDWMRGRGGRVDGRLD